MTTRLCLCRCVTTRLCLCRSVTTSIQPQWTSWTTSCRRTGRKATPTTTLVSLCYLCYHHNHYHHHHHRRRRRRRRRRHYLHWTATSIRFLQISLDDISVFPCLSRQRSVSTIDTCSFCCGDIIDQSLHDQRCGGSLLASCNVQNNLLILRQRVVSMLPCHIFASCVSKFICHTVFLTV